MLSEPPVRLCCFTRHWGVVCPDGRVMCQICFDRFEQDQLAVDDGQKINVCQTCFDHEQGVRARNEI